MSELSQSSASPIERSWQRCLHQGLSRRQSAELDLLPQGELSARQEQHRVLIASFQRFVLPLFGQLLAGRPCRLMLCDGEGAILAASGDDGFARHAERIFLCSGARWGEASKGTNAIGTALAEQSEVQVLGNQHFFAQHSFLSCSACPLLGPDGQLLGVLDISTDAAHHDGDMLGTVRLLAMTLENALLARQPGWLVDLEPQSLWSARLLLGEEGELLGANRAGRLWLGQHPFDGKQLLRDRRGLRLVPEAHPVATLPSLPADAGDSHGRQVPLKMLERGISLLIEGETGSGKEHLVRELHGQSSRRAQPLVCVNCGALPADLVEAELFGYVGGAFSGARSQGSQGYLRAAHGGILMLDEIGELPLLAQTRLLRVLQERAVTPVGSHKPEAVDFWLVSASHRDLAAMVAAGTFREDLYYRICGWRQQLAPLRDWPPRERQALVRRLLAEMDPALRLTDEAERQLLAYPLPGNVRQLKQALEVACVLAEGQGWIELAHLHLPTVAVAPAATTALAGSTLREQNRQRVQQTLTECDGNVSEAARRLGISRTTLYRALREAG
ncbi:TPA: sigma-54-dependent Fis family transcriptional regulator [Aeromonas hydrophila]|uniref:sigma-54-dependent Fis family transcriptional regulator n=1 Tax=Aeromonas TaxID=642 RepID=UPI000909F85F|nr:MULTISPECIES: sigma-54-dependent Fis family transcriptional regulator [Aeromonas]HEB4991512.1 sigma-54-dependent Fis family transcriptional regulator [Aeromonas hydrophila subsp. hydrophila]APJ17458.1 AAA family ATPase [Aeromonas hydrophila]BBT07658.1 sigma-54-dependent Fis family transcriptional regulator [Aeromonas hydrophila]HEB5044127.1 sigma-54-dependent Fis family transcriptional regulator [Aeromonas hydrophila subsp. hydrophila]HEB5075909.1 sigma-54-dependent Fis family transcription